MSFQVRKNTKKFLKIPPLILSLFTLLAPLAVIPQVHAATLFSEYSIPTPSSGPTSITAGPDGAMWFTETDGEKIGRIDSSVTVTNEYPTLNPYISPETITTGPDGAMWYGGDNYGVVGRVGVPDGSVVEYSGTGGAQNILSGSDGNLWYANGDIVDMTTSGTVLNRFRLGSSIAQGLTQDSSGNFWSLDLVANQVVKMTPSGTVSTYAIPDTTVYTFAYPVSCINASCGLTNGSDGNVWFTAPDRKSIGRVTPDGQVKIYTVPTANPGINKITAGPDGALWFTERNANQIGRITTDGQITEYQVPTTDSGPSDLAFDSSGALWFTESNANKIGKLVVVSTPSAPTNLTLTTPSPSNQNPSLTWDASSDATSYNVYRNGVIVGSTTNTTYTDNTAPEGTDTYIVTAVNNNGESTQSDSVSVLLDRTAPTISNVSLATDPISVNNTTTLSANVVDNLSGIAKVEYFAGADPGQGNGTPMSISNGVASATVGSYSTPGMYTYSVRSEDNVGNWSQPMSVTLDVYNPAGGYAAAHGAIVPGVDDILPSESGNNLKASLDFTIKYASPTDSTPTGTASFTWGSTCNNPHSNCFTVTTDTTVTPSIGSLAWLVVPGDNTATFQGTATLSQGNTTSSTNNPIRISIIGTTVTSSGHYEIQVYAVGANPDTATPIYQVSEDLASGSAVLHR